MRQETLKQIKEEIIKVYNMYIKLSKNWNGELVHGNGATYPIVVITEVLLQNMAFDGSNCSGYSLKNDIEELYSKLELLRELNEYNEQGYMTHFPYNECYCIINGYLMSEDEEFDIINLEEFEHITEIPLYITKHNTSLGTGYDTMEIPIGTKLRFDKYGDESQVYSTDPVYANCYSGKTSKFSFNSKWLYTNPGDINSFYTIK